MRPLASLMIAGSLGCSLASQEGLWHVVGPVDHRYSSLAPFGDFDNDGRRDVLVGVFPYANPHPLSWIQEARILSGLDGSVLWQAQVYSSHQLRRAGDMDGDGLLDFMDRNFGSSAWGSAITMWSTRTGQPLWSILGSFAYFGFDLLGDLDTNGDGKPDLVTLTYGLQSEVFVYDNDGTLRYTLPCHAAAFEAFSLAKMGDMDGDGCDDFIVGCNDYQNGSPGVVVMVSGLTGAVLRISHGLQPGDKTFDHVTNLGDIDGDGVNDYAAFPWWSAQRVVGMLWSGRTGALIRVLDPVYTESVVADQDLDLDGVNDLLLSSEYPVNPPSAYGRTQAISGRDGAVLWSVENFTGSGQPYAGWGRFAAGLGVFPGNPYPAVAWMDLGFVDHTLQLNLAHGRVRAFRGTHAGQGPVTGTPCNSSGPPPLIGVRKTSTGSRITIAKSHPAALGALWLSINPLPTPIDLSALGASGCNLYVNADATWLRVLGTTGIDRGYAAVDLAFQLAPAGLGLGVVGQWLVLDPTTLGYATTAMHSLRLQ